MKVYQLFEQAKTWTQRRDARDREGYLTDPSCDAAVCWCAMGGIRRCYPDPVEQEGVVFKLSRYLERVWLARRRDTDYDHEVITRWNDEHGRTKAEVVQVLVALDI